VNLDLLHQLAKMTMGFENFLDGQRGTGEVFFDRSGNAGIENELHQRSLRFGEEDFVTRSDEERSDIEFSGDVGFGQRTRSVAVVGIGIGRMIHKSPL